MSFAQARAARSTWPAPLRAGAAWLCPGADRGRRATCIPAGRDLPALFVDGQGFRGGPDTQAEQRRRRGHHHVLFSSPCSNRQHDALLEALAFTRSGQFHRRENRSWWFAAPTATAEERRAGLRGRSALDST